MSIRYINKDSFLARVAAACLDHYGDLSDFCFLFPNRRSATFFLRALSEQSGGDAILGPEALAVGDFMSRVAEMDVAPRIIQLVELYKAYLDLKGKKPDGETAMDFDKFLSWGEVMLSDFSEIDMHAADPSQIFKNVVRLNEIQADYLDEDLKEEIYRVWKYRISDEEVRMWRHFNRMPDNSELKRKFETVWSMLPNLYEDVRSRMSRYPIRMSTAGAVYLEAMQRVLDKGKDAIPWKHVVTVGLDTLSGTEKRIYGELLHYPDGDGPMIDFFWDIAGAVLSEPEGNIGRNIRTYSRGKFKAPEWASPFFELDSHLALPKITEIAVPGNAMQAKVAGEWVRSLIGRGASDEIAAARVAVVLPDENLLQPLLHSLPFSDDGTDKSGRNSVNLTMGWPMRYTSAASLMYHLERTLSRRLHESANSGNNDGLSGYRFLSDDIRMLLAQPLIQMMVGVATAMEINTMLDSSRRRVVSLDDIRDIARQAGETDASWVDMLMPSDSGSLKECSRWLTDLLGKFDRDLSARPSDENADTLPVNVMIERMQIQIYLTVLNQLTVVAEANGIKMDFHTLFHLVHKMAAGETVSFEGQPLEGLQVMGLLETRALDFDKLLILSMNDRIMPSKSRRRSFILESIRRSFDLPGLKEDEQRYAYWFYRLLSRVSEVTLVYDSRMGEGMRSGGKSRFLIQLEKLYARDKVEIRKRFFTLCADSNVRRDLDKNVPDRLERLEKFSVPKGLNLSASALATYLKCGVQFYYRYVLKFGDDPVHTRSVDALTMGNIFHRVMQRIYSDLYPELFPHALRPNGIMDITTDELNLIIENVSALDKLIVRAINQEYYHLPEEKRDRPLSRSLSHIAERLRRNVQQMLRHDAATAPFILYGCEVPVRMSWNVGGRNVNLKGSIDRLDEVGGHMRVVDYKTGSLGLYIRSMDDVWQAESRAHNVLQLLFYAELLEDIAARGQFGLTPERLANGVEMAIFDANNMGSTDGVRYITNSSSEKRSKKYDHPYHTDSIFLRQDADGVRTFREQLEEKIDEIFNPQVPFRHAADPKICEYCLFASICSR